MWGGQHSGKKLYRMNSWCSLLLSSLTAGSRRTASMDTVKNLVGSGHSCIADRYTVLSEESISFAKVIDAGGSNVLR